MIFMNPNVKKIFDGILNNSKLISDNVNKDSEGYIIKFQKINWHLLEGRIRAMTK